MQVGTLRTITTKLNRLIHLFQRLRPVLRVRRLQREVSQL